MLVLIAQLDTPKHQHQRRIPQETLQPCIVNIQLRNSNNSSPQQCRASKVRASPCSTTHSNTPLRSYRRPHNTFDTTRHIAGHIHHRRMPSVPNRPSLSPSISIENASTPSSACAMDVDIPAVDLVQDAMASVGSIFQGPSGPPMGMADPGLANAVSQALHSFAGLHLTLRHHWNMQSELLHV